MKNKIYTMVKIFNKDEKKRVFISSRFVKSNIHSQRNKIKKFSLNFFTWRFLYYKFDIFKFKKPFVFLSFVFIFLTSFFILKNFISQKNDSELKTDVFVMGGSLGGTISAIEASRNGSSVVLVEELDWLGGQISSQGVSAIDSSSHIYVKSGIYQELSQRIKKYYGLDLNQRGPGNATVGDPSFEPVVGARIIESMARESGVRIFKEHKILKINKKNNRISKVTIKNIKTGKIKNIYPKVVIDGTELGEGMKMAGVSYNLGFDKFEQTGEENAMRQNFFDEFIKEFGNRVQSITYPYALYDRVESGIVLDDKNNPSVKTGCQEIEKDGAWFKFVSKSKNEEKCFISWDLRIFSPDNYFINGKFFEIENEKNIDISIKNSEKNVFSYNNKVDSKNFNFVSVFLEEGRYQVELSFSGKTEFDILEVEKEFLNESGIYNFDEKKLIDNNFEDSEWKKLNNVIGFYGQDYMFQRTDDKNKSAYEWNFSVSESGDYNIYANWPNDSNMTDTAVYRLFSQKPKTEILRTEVSQNHDPVKWKFLGEVSLKKGNYTLTLENSTILTKIMADAIYIEPKTENSFVDLIKCNELECSFFAKKAGNYDVFLKTDKNNFDHLSIKTDLESLNLSKSKNIETYNFISTIFLENGENLKIRQKELSFSEIVLVYRPNYDSMIFNSKNRISEKSFDWEFFNEYPARYEIIVKNPSNKNLNLSIFTNNDKLNFKNLKNKKEKIFTGFLKRGPIKFSSSSNSEIFMREIPFDNYNRNFFMSGNIGLIGSNENLVAENQLSWSNFRHRKILDFEDLKFSDVEFLKNLPFETLGVSQINAGFNDYSDVLVENLEDDEKQKEMFERAKEHSLNSYFWIRNDLSTAHKEILGCNFPNFSGDCNPKRLVLVTEIMDTDFGVSKFPYIREGRRLNVKNPVSENDFARYYLKCENCSVQKCDALQSVFNLESIKTRERTECILKNSNASSFSDSFGVGHYSFDTHPYINFEDRNFGKFKEFLLKIRKNKISEKNPDGFFPTSTNPAEIPLSSMVTDELDFFIVGSKNIGLTQLANASYRVHPTEAHIGSIAGFVASFSAKNNIDPKKILKDEKLLSKLQEKFVSNGKYIAPLEDLVFSEKDKSYFVSANMMFVKGFYDGTSRVENGSIGLGIFIKPNESTTIRTLIDFVQKFYGDSGKKLTCSSDCDNLINWGFYLKSVNDAISFSKSDKYEDLVRDFEKRFNKKIVFNKNTFVSNKEFLEVSWLVAKKEFYS